jgi:hypothetical protein
VGGGFKPGALYPGGVGEKKEGVWRGRWIGAYLAFTRPAQPLLKPEPIFRL